MLQESIKENDPMKVGRFGLGFKSVLHLTGELNYKIRDHDKTERPYLVVVCNIQGCAVNLKVLHRYK